MPKKRVTPAAALVVALASAAAITLSGCSAGGDYSDLQRDRQAGDELPAFAIDNELPLLPDTSRLVGEHEGSQIWLARAEDDGVCIAVAPADERWVVSCGGDELRTGGPAGNFVVVPDRESPPEGTTAISENVSVFGG